MNVQIHSLTVGMFAENTYIVADDETKDAVIFDPGDQPADILAIVEQHGYEVRSILLTHAHIDHILAVPAVHRETGAPVFLHKDEMDFYEGVAMQARMFGLPIKVEDPIPIERHIQPGEAFTWGGVTATALFTPGHSPGEISFRLNDDAGTVICGDTVFAGSIGRTDLPDADHETLLAGIKSELLSLPDSTPLLPGHGPATTVGRERASNPFLLGL